MISQSDFSKKQILVLVPKNGEKLSFSNDNVVIRNAEGKIIHQSTCYRLFAIFIIGHISITSGLIQRSKKFGFSIVFLTSGFHPYEVISAEAEGNVLLRKKQYEYNSLEIGRHITKNKIENQRRLIMSQRNKSEETMKSVKLLEGYISDLSSADTVQSIMGYEGNASRIYFKEVFGGIRWKGRQPRVKADMTNALLDIGYTILFCYMDALLALFGFDRYYGFLHRQFYLRKSLVCDLVEPFRVIIDKQTQKSIHLGQFKETDFKVYDGRWSLEYKHSAEYCNVYFQAINAHKEEIFLYVRDFYRAFMRDKECPSWYWG